MVKERRTVGDGAVSDRALFWRRAGFDFLLILLFAAATFILTVILVAQNVMLPSSRDPGPPPAAAIAQYWVTAGIMIALQIGLLVRAVVSRRLILGLIASAALILAVGAALMLSIPPIDRYPTDPAPKIIPGYHPCYSGSNDCIGG